MLRNAGNDPAADELRQTQIERWLAVQMNEEKLLVFNWRVLAFIWSGFIISGAFQHLVRTR
jgi:hypothetical protein